MHRAYIICINICILNVVLLQIACMLIYFVKIIFLCYCCYYVPSGRLKLPNKHYKLELEDSKYSFYLLIRVTDRQG